MDKLFLVIPAYNEQANITLVAREWHAVVSAVNAESRLIIINDGSKDDTESVLEALKPELHQMIVVSKQNSGHGATVLFGYKYALEHGADYIFQTDSDGQTLPSEFWQFWELREHHSALIGYRNQRQDGLSRVFVTKTLRFVLWCIFRVRVTDANTPFRLMSKDILEKYLPKVPEDFNLSNVILTLCFVKYKEDVMFIPITFRPRQGGVNSINFRRIVGIGKKALKDFRMIKKML
jgi:glycosyltransferase involved in cell wall biosynthesis